MQNVLLENRSDAQIELARLGRSATYRATRVVESYAEQMPPGDEPWAHTAQRMVTLAAQIAAYLARTLSLGTASRPRYELAADVAQLWARDRHGNALSADETIRAAYVTLVAATSSDIVWTQWEWAAARLKLAVALVGAAEDASDGWQRLRDQGISIAERSGYDLASAASNAAFWPALKEGFTVPELRTLLEAVPAEGSIYGLEARIDLSYARQIAPEFTQEQLSDAVPPGSASRLLPEPIDLGSRTAEEPRPEPQAEMVRVSDDRTVRVWFATNRCATNDGSFDRRPSTTTTHGYVDFEVGANAVRDVRQTGIATDEIEFSPLAAPTVLEPADFITQLNDHGATERIMLYVHGYNNPFNGSLQRAAQLAWDLAIDAPIIVFCWPSFGSWLRYNYDRGKVEGSSIAFTEFVELLPTTAELDVVAHSMGNRLLALSIDAISRSMWAARRPMRTLALAAADLEVSTYSKVASKYNTHLGGQAAVYVSRGDGALWLSGLKNSAPVLGHGGKGTTIVPMESVDADRVNTFDFWGHNYFAKSPAVLCDLAYLIHGQTNSARQPKQGQPNEWEL